MEEATASFPSELKGGNGSETTTNNLEGYEERGGEL